MNRWAACYVVFLLILPATVALHDDVEEAQHMLKSVGVKDSIVLQRFRENSFDVSALQFCDSQVFSVDIY